MPAVESIWSYGDLGAELEAFGGARGLAGADGVVREAGDGRDGRRGEAERRTGVGSVGEEAPELLELTWVLGWVQLQHLLHGDSLAWTEVDGSARTAWRRTRPAPEKNLPDWAIPVTSTANRRGVSVGEEAACDEDQAGDNTYKNHRRNFMNFVGLLSGLGCSIGMN